VAYIGTAPTAGQYRKLDSISSSFNGSTTTFTMQVGGQNVSAGTPAQLLISLGGVIQQPTTDYTVSTNSLTFVTAPASGLSFFAILMGDALSVGTPADGSVSTAKLATGLTVDLTSGSAAAPSLTFDANTGLYSPAEDTIGFVEGGVEAARIDSSGRLLVGTSSSRDVASAGPSIVQIEGSSFRHLSMVQNSNDDNGVTLAFGKSRGTSAGGTTIVQNNDDIARLRFAGANGSDVATVAAEIQCQIDGTPGVSNDMPGRLVFSTTLDGASSPTERMRISNGGRIDTFCTQSVALNVASSLAAGTSDIIYVGKHSGTGSPGTGTNAIIIYTNGNIQNLNNSYGSLSDQKLKENIVDAASQWNDLKDLQIRKYNFKAETGNQTHTQIGLIAQEVELVSPGLVTESPDRDAEGNDLGTVTKSVNYSVLYMKAVKALQEAMERIEQLEAEMTEVKAQLA